MRQPSAACTPAEPHGRLFYSRLDAPVTVGEGPPDDTTAPDCNFANLKTARKAGV